MCHRRYGFTIQTVGFLLALAWSSACAGMTPCLLPRAAAAEQEQTPAQPFRLTAAEIDRVVRSRCLPWTLAEITAHLRATITHDRPVLLQRTWQVLRAVYRYEAVTQELALLTTVRDNLAALYHLQRQQQRRSEIDDREVMKTQNALLAQDIEVVQRTAACRLLILDILEAGNCLDLRDSRGRGNDPERGEDVDASPTTAGGADAGRK